ncbi:hypothetical protein DXT77_14720 [Pseudomonas sp. 91RF]|uniref:hypothetical protein n=1 Tax=Pseudomonas sp. 91RF TaxID=2292261 RepID=UPI000E66F013|nr:hypothetical protein [Pseudomonas sp. 91RF]RIJ09699.1 hypothetical protein DXT77_14720 [Pseudomonas sp. 91RF]
MNQFTHLNATKVFYNPIEVAIRWSDLLEHEPEILGQVSQGTVLMAGVSGDWSLLNLNLERLLDAMRHGELPYGKAGITQNDPALLTSPELTVRHVDVKRWIAVAYPAHKPAFLFDESERLPMQAIDQAAAQALLQQIHSLTARSMTRQRSSQEESQLRLNSRAETTYLNIIGALLTLLLGHSPGGVRYSAFNTLESVISALIAHHSGRPGITERTLWAKFAEARRQLSAHS